VAYHRALTRDTRVVRAVATVLSMGKRVAFTEAKLYDAEGRPCASASSTLLVFDKKP
jgi:acyl-coenzyme A thioesterase PaaI-like protein